MRLDALFTLGFPSAPALEALTLPHTATPRIIMQKVRGHPVFRHGAPTARRYMVSGTISLP